MEKGGDRVSGREEVRSLSGKGCKVLLRVWADVRHNVVEKL